MLSEGICEVFPDQISTRIMILDAGRIIATGTMEKLKEAIEACSSKRGKRYQVRCPCWEYRCENSEVKIVEN